MNTRLLELADHMSEHYPKSEATQMLVQILLEEAEPNPI